MPDTQKQPHGHRSKKRKKNAEPDWVKAKAETERRVAKDGEIIVDVASWQDVQEIVNQHAELMEAFRKDGDALSGFFASYLDGQRELSSRMGSLEERMRTVRENTDRLGVVEVEVADHKGEIGVLRGTKKLVTVCILAAVAAVIASVGTGLWSQATANDAKAQAVEAKAHAEKVETKVDATP